MNQTNLKNKIKPLLKQKAFTLIELLVVIAIIGVLASVVLASLNIAREKAQWSAFVQETNQIITAIESYVSDNNGDYMSLVRGGEWEGYYTNSTSVTEYLMNIVYYTLVRDGYISYNPNYARSIVPYHDQSGYISIPNIMISINESSVGCPIGDSPYILYVYEPSIIPSYIQSPPWHQSPRSVFQSYWCLYPFR